MKGKIIFLGLILLISSCNKIEDAYVKGKVYDSETGNPIPNAKVTLYKWRRSPFFAPANYSYDSVTTRYTDKNGAYYLPLHKGILYRYQIHCSHPNFNNPKPDQFELRYRINKHDFQLNPAGFIKFRFKKTTQSKEYFRGTINSYYKWMYFYHEMPCDTILPTVYKARDNAINFIDWTIADDQSSGLYMTPVQVYVARHDTVLVFFQIN